MVILTIDFKGKNKLDAYVSKERASDGSHLHTRDEILKALVELS